VPALLSLDIPGFEGRNVLLIAFLVIVVQISDVLQYVWGKLAGRRKVIPRVSPGKTVAGFVGGVATTTLVAWLAAPWLTPLSLQHSLSSGCCYVAGLSATSPSPP
jgi:phosphatidate cytidylyltransferase